MVGLVALMCLLTTAFRERIGINQGQGWDGMGYVAWAQEFSHHFLAEGITKYYSQRILPSAVVGFVVNLIAKPSVQNTIVGFQVLDCFALVGAAFIWTRISVEMLWTRVQAWSGYLAIFLSFACARHALYYPTLTDPAAFLLGMIATWGFLTKRPALLWSSLGLSLFTWPALAPHALLMLLFPRNSETVNAADSAHRASAKRLGLVIAVVAAAAYTLLSLHYYRDPLPAPGFDKFVKWIRADVLTLSAALTAALVGWGTYVLISQPLALKWRHSGSRNWRRILLMLAGVLCLLLLRAWWIHRVGIRGDGPTISEFVCQQALESLRGPAWGPVHHIVYFGPIIVIAILLWRKVAQTATNWGVASVATLAVVVAFAPGSESRQWIHLFPFLVAVVVASLPTTWTWKRFVVFAVIAIGWSKVWLHLGYDNPGNWLEFPNQKYFMHLGPWASDKMYLAHLVAALATTAVLYFLLANPSDQGVVRS